MYCVTSFNHQFQPQFSVSCHQFLNCHLFLNIFYLPPEGIYVKKYVLRNKRVG